MLMAVGQLPKLRPLFTVTFTGIHGNKSCAATATATQRRLINSACGAGPYLDLTKVHRLLPRGVLPLHPETKLDTLRVQTLYF